MTQTLIEKLEALATYKATDAGTMIRHAYGQYISQSDLRAIIEEHKRESVEAVGNDNGYIEGTAERLRLICSKLGIGAPVSNEEIMFCQFSLFGAIRRKIDELYSQPSHTQLIGELLAALESNRRCLVNPSMREEYDCAFGEIMKKAREVVKHDM